MRVKIKVTQKHIDRGEVGDCQSCPLALALTEAGADYACVGYLDAMIGIFTPLLTKRMQKFVRDFDNEVIVAPCTFTWNIPNGAMPKAERK